MDLSLLEDAIYYLKVPELEQYLATLRIAAGPRKEAMIAALLRFAGLSPTPTDTSDSESTSLSAEAKRTLQARFSQQTHIVPGYYTNGPASRVRFKQLIGPQFSFTSYGMEWIRRQWAADRCPTYQEFATFWQTEFERRKAGGAYASKKTLQRVQFFRKMGGQGLSKVELERAWTAERQRQAGIARAILDRIIADRSA